MTQTFHANGKLLLTAEYFILDGAVGLALPSKFGQSLKVEDSSENGLTWESFDHKNEIWFSAKFDEQFTIIHTTNVAVAEILQVLLQKSNCTHHNAHITTKLDFPNHWGLGSSSTLISLIAQWTNANPYELLQHTFGGSAYDIACATAKNAISYQLTSQNTRQITALDFNPAFKENIYFVHLGKKQNSREGIQLYKKSHIDKTTIIEQINELTHKIIHAIDLDEFCYYLEVHENIIANALNLQKVKETFFQDFPGTVKSLGAWGGDFIMVCSDEKQEMITHYFQNKGFSTIIPYNAMIL